MGAYENGYVCIHVVENRRCPHRPLNVGPNPHAEKEDTRPKAAAQRAAQDTCSALRISLIKRFLEELLTSSLVPFDPKL